MKSENVRKALKRGNACTDIWVFLGPSIFYPRPSTFYPRPSTLDKNLHSKNCGDLYLCFQGFMIPFAIEKQFVSITNMKLTLWLSVYQVGVSSRGLLQALLCTLQAANRWDTANAQVSLIINISPLGF